MHINIAKVFPSNPRVLIQGATGKEGQRALNAMRAYGTNVVAGVTPGKGDTTVSHVPIFDSVAQAVKFCGHIDMAVQFVPPLRTLAATMEALAAGIPFVLVGAEKVPVHDALRMVDAAKKREAMLIGPGSVGMICPRLKLKIGMIGGDTPERAFASGNIAVLSKSGGMTSEIALALKSQKLGVSLACGIGGERIVGSDFADTLEILEHDEHTKAAVIFGEIGGFAEERVAKAVKKKIFTKPLVAFIVGEFVAQLNSEVSFGHTGAILDGGRGTVLQKRETLREAGVRIAEQFDDIVPLLME